MRLLLMLVLAASTAHAASEGPGGAGWPEPGTTWRSLRLDARKGPFKASASLVARRLPAPEVLSELRDWPEGGARKPVGEVARFDVKTRATFRGEASRTTWADAAGLLQDDAREGKRTSVRRFGVQAVHSWKQRGHGLLEERHAELGAAEGRILVDFPSLLWLATGRRLDREGARMSAAVLSKGRVVELDLESSGDLRALTRGGVPVRARRVLIRTSDPEEESSLFGMKGDVELYLDTADGMPVELRGTIAKLGAVRVRVTASETESEADPPSAR